MILLDDYEEIKRKHEEAKQQKNRSEGALASILKQIRKEFGAKSIESAQQLLEKMKDEESVKAKEYIKCRKVFDKKWSDANMHKEPDPFISDIMKRQLKNIKKYKKEK